MRRAVSARRCYGIEAVQVTRLVADPSVQAAFCAMAFLAAAFKMTFPRASSDACSVAANVTLWLLVKMATDVAPGTRSTPLSMSNERTLGMMILKSKCAVATRAVRDAPVAT